jgi:conjugal transfer/entry exclusion protein
MKELFIKYAEIENQIKELENQKSALKEKVAEEMTLKSWDEVKSDFGTFYFISRKTWTYPKNILDIEKQLKDEKKTTEINGTATFKESKSLGFRGIKEK